MGHGASIPLGCATIEIKSSKARRGRPTGSNGSGRHSPSSSVDGSDWNSDLRRVESDPFFKSRKQASFRTAVLGGLGVARSSRANQIAKLLAPLQKSGWGNAAARLQALEELFLLLEDGKGLNADEVAGEDTAAGLRALCSLAATGTDDDVVAGNQLVLKERAAALAVLVSMCSSPEAGDLILRLTPGSQLLDIGEGLSTEIEVHLAVDLIRRLCATEEFRFQFSGKPLVARVVQDVRRCAAEALGPAWVGPLAVAAEMVQKEKMQRAIVEAGLGPAAVDILRQHVGQFAEESPAELLVLQADCCLVAALASQFEEDIWRPIAEGAPTVIGLVRRYADLVQERGLAGRRAASPPAAGSRAAAEAKADEREMALRNEVAGYGLRALLDLARKGAVDPFLKQRVGESAAFVRALVRLVLLLEASRSWDHRPLASMCRQLIEALSSRDEATAATAREESAAAKAAEAQGLAAAVASPASRLEPLVGPRPGGRTPGVSRRRSSVADVSDALAQISANARLAVNGLPTSFASGAGVGGRTLNPSPVPPSVQPSRRGSMPGRPGRGKAAELSVAAPVDLRGPSPGPPSESRRVLERIKSGVSSAFSSFRTASPFSSFRGEAVASPTASATLAPLTPRNPSTPRVKAL